MSPGLRPVRAIKEKLDPKPERRRCQTGKASRAELADGEEEATAALAVDDATPQDYGDD